MSDKNVNTQGVKGTVQVPVKCNSSAFLTVTISDPGEPPFSSGNICADLAKAIGEVIYDLAHHPENAEKYAAEDMAEQNGVAYVRGGNPSGTNYAPAGSELDQIITTHGIDISFHTNRIDTNVPHSSPGKAVNRGAKVWHISIPDRVAPTSVESTEPTLTTPQYKLLLGAVAICGCRFT